MTTEIQRDPSPEQQEAIEELALEHDAVGVTWDLPLGTLIVVVACFDMPTGCASCSHERDRHGTLSRVCLAPRCICAGYVAPRRPVETKRYRILRNGLVLGIPEHHRARDLEIQYPDDDGELTRDAA